MSWSIFKWLGCCKETTTGTGETIFIPIFDEGRVIVEEDNDIEVIVEDSEEIIILDVMDDININVEEENIVIELEDDNDIKPQTEC